MMTEQMMRDAPSYIRQNRLLAAGYRREAAELARLFPTPTRGKWIARHLAEAERLESDADWYEARLEFHHGRASERAA